MSRFLTLAIAFLSAWPVSAEEPKDPFRWLEDVTGDKALAWVKERNATTKAELATSAEFVALNDRLLKILDSKDRIPTITKHGPLSVRATVSRKRGSVQTTKANTLKTIAESGSHLVFMCMNLRFILAHHRHSHPRDAISKTALEVDLAFYDRTIAWKLICRFGLRPARWFSTRFWPGSSLSWRGGNGNRAKCRHRRWMHPVHPPNSRQFQAANVLRQITSDSWTPVLLPIS